MPSTSVVVPIFNGSAFLPAFFASLNAALPHDAQLILVDDASDEPVWDSVPAMPAARSVVRLRNEQNLGYSVAVNRGLSAATGEIVVQLNTDLILDSSCISAMLDLIDRERDVGIVGSKLVFPTTGRIQHIGMAFGNYTKLHIFSDLPAAHPLCCRTRSTQITTGATVAMTRRVLDRIGPLEEAYFNHNEDIEHCLLAVRHGLRNFTCAESVAYHWESHSGPARFARTEVSDAIFWSRWGASLTVDLPGYVDEALDHLLDSRPDLLDVPFAVVDLSRGSDQAIVLDRLLARWPGLGDRVRRHRQTNAPAPRLWLPLVLPHWVAHDPTPFIYVVDSHREMRENAAWFETRSRIVADEIVVDLNGAALLAAQLDSA